MLKIEQPVTRAAAAADEIRRRIVAGELQSGQQLKQEALADEFNMSRIPLREAFRQLEAEGLVIVVPHKGAVVSDLSLAEIEELFDLRALLEPRLLRRSADKLLPSDFAQLDRILSVYATDLRANRNVAEWGELNTELHTLLYRHAGQPRTMAIVAQLLKNTDRFTRLQIAMTDGHLRAEREHAELVSLCRTGRIDDAARLLKDHIRHAGAALMRHLAGSSHPTREIQSR